ncbi:2107_t:CDS:10, partial [Acaulospora colombiana]
SSLWGDGSDIETWFNSRQSFWSLLHFYAIAKGATSEKIGSLSDAYQNGVDKSVKDFKVDGSLKEDTGHHPGPAIGSIGDYTSGRTSKGLKLEYQWGEFTRITQWTTFMRIIGLIQNNIKDIFPRIMNEIKHSQQDVQQTVLRVHEQLVRHVKKDMPQLIDIFRHSNQVVREAAVTDMVPQIMILFTDPNSLIHQTAVAAIGKVSHYGKYTGFRRVLRLIESVEWLHGIVKDAIPRVVETIQGFDPKLRAAAIVNLIQLTQYEMVQNGIFPLIYTFQNTDPSAYQEVILLFGSLAKYGRDLDWLQDMIKDMTPQVIVLFKDSNPAIRCAAGQLIGQLAQFESNVREEAVKSFGQLAQCGGFDSVWANRPTWFVFHRDGVQNYRHKSAERLQYAIRSEVPKLVGTFKHLDVQARYWLQGTIRDAIPQFIEVFEDSEYATCQEAVEAFVQIAQH